MFRIIRRFFALVSLLLITLLFLDFTGIAQYWWGWIARIQFVPAFLSINALSIIFLLLLTLIFGRLYCSVICPLGIFQDVVAHIKNWVSKKNNRKKYTYESPKTWIRIGVMVIFVILLILGLCNIIGTTIASFIEPYSAYGRIVSSLFAPIYKGGNNIIADLFVDSDYYRFYQVEIYNYLPITIIGIVTFIVVGIISWIGGRAYCNTICPVGTILGFLSKYSLYKPVIDVKKCNGCAKCARNCKASCIDAKNHTIDYSRCVVCMNCLNNCSKGAIKYQRKSKKCARINKEIDNSRRNFMTISSIIATTSIMKATDKTIDGGLAPLIGKQSPIRKTKIVPPGSVSLDHLQKHCTGCQLCISVCPNGVLRPSTNLTNFMQPVVEYDKGYCRPECVSCSNVCPVGAFHPISVEEKSSIQIGRAVVKLDECIISSKGKRCGNCADKCPTGAIKIIPINPSDERSRYMPIVNESKCIGCGACEYYCPVRPLSAIYVIGNEVHHSI